MIGEGNQRGKRGGKSGGKIRWKNQVDTLVPIFII
jgi:hypothetical protein